MKFRLQMPFLLAFLVFGAFAHAVDDPIESFRTWKDRTGKHEIEAEFVNYTRSVVELKKSDGSIIKVPLKDLSNADKWYVRKHLRNLKKRDLKTPELEQNTEVIEKEDRKPAKVNLARKRNTKRLFGIDWHQTPESMQAAAGLSSKNQKPVMWFRVLGDLDGYM